MWLVDVLSGPPLELADVQGREEDSADYHTRNVDGEPLERAKVSTVFPRGILVHQGVDIHGICTVAEDPETEELTSEELVAVLQLFGLGSVGGDCVLTGASCWGSCGSVTPGDVVKVAHGVDLQNVGEGGQQKDVGNHTDHVGLGVVDEVKWSHEDWNKVNGEHDDSAEGGNLEMVPVFFVWNIL